ncbi:MULTISPECIES: arginine synthesis PII-interacting regulator PirA [Chroococcidiopsis]|jgi:hypothetical protein|uniref:Uncharacterized protein n=2 Tax=Chroococcidiopsis TaxID=54298 RepID=K9U1Q9_CHRTP|nr:MULTISPECIES: hypothetical protein [Chroococcidiopsis]MBE9016921.1 hypothetical protein [Chroococcidiopsidales cyanobacterium LEGE 13417]AFY88356.1 hypothetical protein Chro_2888 [Chroococcidiopsis thermalis PCC 7203]MBD2305847.1 hypothetical protein [Chroococcidiopsis sp. [FACHB-1243]]MDZ4871889.1 hypothetical protein [Chroococcidiopsis cubana SAG 39.79]RUT02321.1 hypothetical protein DSM107010_62970 [Chroococcidiopsis cubana SAG 39.79]
MNASRKPSYKEVARVHRSNILESLERRLQAARAKGDDRLTSQLEAELKYYQ